MKGIKEVYAYEIKKKLEAAGIVRVEIDDRAEKIGYKIREAQLKKIPYMVVLGDKEIASQTVSVRHRNQGDLGSLTVEDFITKVKKEVAEKSIN